MTNKIVEEVPNNTDLTPIRVLIVDDDEEDFFITSEFIRNIKTKNFIIDWSYSYQDALDRICSAGYDIYFIDYYLGAHTGLELLKEAIARQCEQPLILLTGMGNPRIDVEAMQAGAFDYLVKLELNTEKIERTIRYAIERATTLKILKAKEKKFRNVFEQSRDAVFLTDPELRFKDVNLISAELFGYGQDELIGMSLYDFLVNKDEKRSIQENLKRIGHVEDKEVEIMSKSLEKISCIISLSIEKDGEDYIYVQGILHDITNLKNSEKITLQAEKLGAANRLVRTLAHEVRNPLNNINLSIDQLLQENGGEITQLYLDIIRRNSKRINDLISQLLDSSSYQEENALERKALQAILDECISTIMDRILLKKVNWKVIYPDEPAYIMADPPKLKIAFTNIIINAIEAMKEEQGQLDISVSIQNGHHLVYIKDNGSGISPENLPHLFEPYFTFKRNGLGIGLATTLNIIRSHKGSIDVQTSLENGSTFILKFERA
ncbi:MAG: hybrid sensor histidine kinase/response regulator [Bacteroidetes bacterium]|nr:MAG: hybrid sensor histidine kinase/response regulator [Bacteroidota bacterium]